LGGRKGIRPVKNWEWWGAGVVVCLERGADLHMAQQYEHVSESAPILRRSSPPPPTQHMVPLVPSPHPNGTSIGSATFAGLTVVPSRQIDRQTETQITMQPNLYSTKLRPDIKRHWWQ